MAEINKKEVDLILEGVELPEYTTKEVTEVKDELEEYNRTEIRYRDKNGKTVRHDGYFDDGDILIKVARNGENTFFFNGQTIHNVSPSDEHYPCGVLCIKEWFSPAKKSGFLVTSLKETTSYDSNYQPLKKVTISHNENAPCKKEVFPVQDNPQ